MKQNFNYQELSRYLKKGELVRNKLEAEDIESKVLTIEEQILTENFSFDIKSNSEYYWVESLSEKLLLRKLNDNIKRIYKNEQANRKFIIQQVKTLLKEDAPFWIIKTDIKSFYESIDREKIFRKLKNDAMLSYYSFFLLRKIFENIASNGLPRGLNISSSLSEIYMRKFDKKLQMYEGVYYYARFVDDIIIFLNNKERALKLYYDDLNKIISDLRLSLQINEDKTELIDGKDFKILKRKCNIKSVHNNIEYLGYKFSLEIPVVKNKKGRTLSISIADKKIKKIKTRLAKSYVDFCLTNDFELLKKRVLFLTGNYAINKSSDGSILKAGIYFNYSHINNFNVLKELNQFHRKIIYGKKGSLGVKLNIKLTTEQRNILKKYCFIEGFKKKTFNSFTFEEMGKITKRW